MALRMAGIAYVKADGVQFQIKGNVECPVNNRKRELMMGVSGPMGMKETAKEPYVKFDAGFVADFPINQIISNTNMTITVEYANGKVYTLTEAFESGDAAAGSEEGTVGLEFFGMEGVWS